MRWLLGISEKRLAKLVSRRDIEGLARFGEKCSRWKDIKNRDEALNAILDLIAPPSGRVRVLDDSAFNRLSEDAQVTIMHGVVCRLVRTRNKELREVRGEH